MQTTTETMTDEPLDIRKITPDNMEELAQLTGRPVTDLQREYQWAQANQREVLMLVNNPLIRPRRPKRRELCEYDSTWSQKVGWVHICRIHNRPTWHNIGEWPTAPCIEIDPKPADA